MLRLGSPFYLLLFLPLAAAAWAVYRRRVRQALLFAPTARIPREHATWRTRLRPIAPLLYLAGLALCIIALARPQTVFSRSTRSSDAIAIQMTVDCSGSMQALDFSTAVEQRTRLDVIKETFAAFIEKRPGDLIGLVTFGGFASSRAPLTLDHQSLIGSLRAVQLPKQAFDARGNLLNQEEFNTAIGDALATACARLEKAAVKSRIVVLLTDGESNTGVIKPEEAAKAAKAMGIRVYTIGVGSNGESVPVLGRDQLDRPVVFRARFGLDEDLLRSIATTTGGQYFNVTDPKGLARAMESINKLEKTVINTEIYNQYDEHFLAFLLPALGLLALGAVVNGWLGRAVV